MSKEREALKVALEALNHYEKAGLATVKTIDAITAIKEALMSVPDGAQPEQKPVAWAQFSEAGNLIDLLEEPCGGYVPLYTTPPPVSESDKRKPLTDEQWQVIADTLDCFITRSQKDIIEDTLDIADKEQP